jgi:hypothetical protein
MNENYLHHPCHSHPHQISIAAPFLMIRSSMMILYLLIMVRLSWRILKMQNLIWIAEVSPSSGLQVLFGTLMHTSCTTMTLSLCDTIKGMGHEGTQA